MTAKKPPTRRRVPSHPVTKRELRENNPSIADQVVDRFAKWKNLALTFTAIGAAIAILYQAYFWMGGRAIITDYALDKAITGVKTEVNTKITDTKNEVVGNQNTMKTEITGSIGELNKTLNSVAKNQNAAAMDQADVQMRLAFTQKQALQGQLAVVNQALAKDGNDQLAITRKMQLEDFIKQNDTYMQDAQTKMTRLRNAQ
jgi:hypothetical protein